MNILLLLSRHTKIDVQEWFFLLEFAITTTTPPLALKDFNPFCRARVMIFLYLSSFMYWSRCLSFALDSNKWFVLVILNFSPEKNKSVVFLNFFTFSMWQFLWKNLLLMNAYVIPFIYNLQNLDLFFYINLIFRETQVFI